MCKVKKKTGQIESNWLSFFTCKFDVTHTRAHVTLCESQWLYKC